jgi:hypothetical protein
LYSDLKKCGVKIEKGTDLHDADALDNLIGKTVSIQVINDD